MNNPIIGDLALSLLNAAPHATLGLEDRRIIFASIAVERVFGWKPDELIGQSTRMLFPTEEEFLKVGESFYPALENQPRVIIGEHPCIHKDGSVVICRLSAARVGSNLVNRKVVVTFENISDLRRIETRLLESEALYRNLAEGTFAGVYVVQDGRFIYINKHATENLGYRPEELIGRTVHSIVYKEDRKNIRESASAMLRGAMTTPYIFRVVNKKGKIRWIMETVTNITYGGRPAILGNNMDITELRESQNKIEKFNELRSSILDATPHAIIYLADRKIIFANDAVESVFGWKPEELIGKTTKILFRSEKDYREMGGMAYSTLEKSRVYDESEYMYKHKDGREIVCRVKAVRIGDNLQNRAIIATYEDITQQLQTIKELKFKTKNLEETNTALSVILKRREADKSAIEESVVNNIRELVMPCIQQIKKYRLDSAALKHVSLAESYLTDIVSPFLRKLSTKHLHLTQKELQVANLLKDGKSSKEIADILNITVRGVEFHRYRIRSKLGIRGTKDNLRSYLLEVYSNNDGL
ncbi:PAS domain S-box protein [Desulfocastanea catecholica]